MSRTSQQWQTDIMASFGALCATRDRSAGPLTNDHTPFAMACDQLAILEARVDELLASKKREAAKSDLDAAVDRLADHVGCECAACVKRRGAAMEAAEAEARETESLAHRLETAERRIQEIVELGASMATGMKKFAEDVDILKRRDVLKGDRLVELRNDTDALQRRTQAVEARCSAINQSALDRANNLEGRIRIAHSNADRHAHHTNERLEKLIAATVGEGFEIPPPGAHLAARVASLEMRSHTHALGGFAQ